MRQRSAHDYILHLKLHLMQNSGDFPDKFHGTYWKNLHFHRINNFPDNLIHPPHFDIVEIIYSESEKAL